MGLFGKLLGKEGPKPQKAVEVTKPAESKESKTVSETGRERVERIVDAAKALWAGLRGKLSTGLERAKNGTMAAIFATVGGVEKGAGAGARGFKAGVEGTKAAGRYASESAQEAVELTMLGVERGVEMGVAAGKMTAEVSKDVALAIGAAGVLAAAGAAAVAVELGRRGIEVASKAGKETVNAAVALEKMGVNAAEAVRTFGAEKLNLASEAAKRAKEFGLDLTARGAVTVLEAVIALEEAGVDLKNAMKEKGREYIQKGAEIYDRAKEGTRDIARRGLEAKDRFFGHVGAAKDSFYAKINQMRLKLAGTAELKGEVEALREQVARLSRLVETQNRLMTVRPKIVYEEVDEEAVQTQNMGAR